MLASSKKVLRNHKVGIISLPYDKWLPKMMMIFLPEKQAFKSLFILLVSKYETLWVSGMFSDVFSFFVHPF